jgi:hypothetical protein
MKYLKKCIISVVMSLFAVSFAYAIDIEPEHDVIIEQPTIVAPTAPLSGQDIKKMPYQPTQQLSQIVPQKLPDITTQENNTNSVILPSNEQRIYYARSVTSNNPEYKTRFSILHNTPSPKRIAGERLYNISDNFFRLSVVGNKISILDNPVLNLIGINSAVGRYGEIKFLDGSLLTIHNTSKNFKGSWDLDGSGERMLKITPTNLISGVIPVHIKTFKPDGSVITDEIHDLTFKALAMGPYNGYWSDGADIGIFLWGMSNLKLKSKEMVYLGLDLGIVTQNAVENTDTIAEPEEELLSNSIIPSAPNNNNPVQPFGDHTYSSIPFMGGIGGGGLGGGWYGGGGGGGNQILDCTKTPNDPRCLVDCTKTPNDPRCLLDCTKTPNDPRCLVDCTKTPNDPRCLIDCIKTPNDPRCLIDCIKTPNDPRCLIDCIKTPNDPRCVIDCIKKPNDPRCVIDCIKTPNDPRCVIDCIKHPTAPGCQVDCVAHPNDPRCVIDCIKHPTNPKCSNFCKENPNHPICCDAEVDCKKNPLAAGCENYCTQNPRLPECCVLNPDKCQPIDMCIHNPNLAHCKPDQNPVSEPFAPLVLLASIMGYLFLRRKQKNT